MDNRRLYEASVSSALEKIAVHAPDDLVARFAEKSGIHKDDFHEILPGPSGTVSAVDGSNAMVLEGASIALAAIRAWPDNLYRHCQVRPGHHAPHYRDHRPPAPEQRLR